MFRYRHLLSVLALAFTLTIGASCGGGSSPIDPPQVIGDPQNKPGPGNHIASAGAYNGEYDDPTDFALAQAEWDMIFGQSNPWGDSELVNVAGQWYMRYTLTQGALDAGWRYCGAHVHVWRSGQAPKGAPGQFDYKWTYNGTEADLRTSYDLALGSFDPAAGLYNIAIHGVVCKWGITGYDDLGNALYGEVANETGWGGQWDEKFGGRGAHWTNGWKNKWGGWMASSDTWDLGAFAAFDANYTGVHYGPFSYWQININSPSAPYPFPGSNPFVGWCTDPRYYNSYVPVDVKVYSCYDTNMPGYAKSENWDLISYMIDQRNDPDPGGPFAGVNWTNNANKDAFQNAVWYFKYGPDTPWFSAAVDNTWYVTITDGSLADSFIDYAIANGKGYYPNEVGEWYASILFPVEPYDYNGNRGGLIGFQMNIIEVDP